ncbi:hypothetical protein [Pontibacter sp. G13]|uniref:hypothetical protein n=1 Tax=Pontibacter sp. G13 TaxID=3074898 RepID=UPI00288B4489|nr:hypothetical protein [Pontibacter sp. G13]WNJ17885.1 hypothetical protein RJD25_23780 [Pontibacter sp. G13]
METRHIQPDHLPARVLFFTLSTLCLAVFGWQYYHTGVFSWKPFLVVMGGVFLLSGLGRRTYKLSDSSLTISRLYGLWIRKLDLDQLIEIKQDRQHTSTHPLYRNQFLLGWISSRKAHQDSFRFIRLKFEGKWFSTYIDERFVAEGEFDSLFKFLKNRHKRNVRLNRAG